MLITIFYYLQNPELPKDLYISNTVMINSCFGDIPLYNERGDYAPTQALMMKPT
jgi:hypothetical protein